MKKLLIASAIAAASFSPQAFAQAKNFEGFSVLGGLTAANSKYDFNANPGSTSFSTSKTAANVQLQAEYGFAVSNSVVLGLGIMAGLGDLSFGTPPTATDEVKLKDNLSVYIAPGVALSNSTLLYGKLASASATASSNGTASLSGLGYGIGARFLTGKNMFLQAEYVYTKFDDKSNSTGTAQPNSAAFSFGIGYKF